MGYVVRSSRRS